MNWIKKAKWYRIYSIEIDWLRDPRTLRLHICCIKNSKNVKMNNNYSTFTYSDIPLKAPEQATFIFIELLYRCPKCFENDARFGLLWCLPTLVLWPRLLQPVGTSRRHRAWALKVVRRLQKVGFASFSSFSSGQNADDYLWDHFASLYRRGHFVSRYEKAFLFWCQIF